MTSDLSQMVGQAFYGRFRSLRPIQEQCVTSVLGGHDTLVVSPTGSGKTEAVLAPLMDRYRTIMTDAAGCTILYIVPTRALANDLERRITPPIRNLGFEVGIRHGERNDLNRVKKPHVLITTPESLDVMLTGRSAEGALGSVKCVVLDEVHLTYNSQRGLQVSILIRRLEQLVGCHIQVSGLSASIADPSDIWRFFRPGQPVTTVLDRDDKEIVPHILPLDNAGSLKSLFDTLGRRPRVKVLVFTNSRRECESLATDLIHRTAFGDRVYVHHSSLSRNVRLDVEEKFGQPGRAVCIATSTLELGIDIGDIDVVVLYGLPSGWESFLQRIGRGNRRSEKSNVVCVASEGQGNVFLSILGFMALLALVRTGRLEQEEPKLLYGALAQQLLSLVLAGKSSYERVADLTQVFSALPYVDRATIERILDHLGEQRYLVRHGFQNRYGAGTQLHLLEDLRLVWGNFPSRSRDVLLMSPSAEIGTIPAFNLLRFNTGDVIEFAGGHWQIRQINSDHIKVERTSRQKTIEMSYSGSKPALDPLTVEEVWRLLRDGITATDELSQKSRLSFFEAAEAIRPYLSAGIPYSTGGGFKYYFTFAGQTINSAIAGCLKLSTFEAGDVCLATSEPIDFQSLPEMGDIEPYAIASLNVPGDLTFFQSLLPPELLHRELAETWRKTPVFQRLLARLRESPNVPIPWEIAKPLQDSGW